MRTYSPTLLLLMVGLTSGTIRAQHTFIRVYGADTASEAGSAVLNAPDGGFWMSGYDVLQDSMGGYVGNGILMRVDAAGNERWRQRYAWPGLDDLTFSAMAHHGADGLVVAGMLNRGIVGGSSDYDTYVARFDTAGNLLWSRAWEAPLKQWAYDVAVLPDGGLVTTGRNQLPGGMGGGILLQRLTAQGDTLWRKTLVDGPPGDQTAYALGLTSDGGFVIGAEQNYGLTGRAQVLRTDANGDTLWTRTLSDLYTSRVNDLLVTDVGHVIITGSAAPFGSAHPFVAELDANGTVLWTRVLDEIAFGWAYAIRPFASGYALGGMTSAYDAFIMAIDATGEPVWWQTYDELLDYGWALNTTPDGGLALTGESGIGGPLNSDVLLIRTNELGEVLPAGAFDAPVADPLFTVAPNPVDHLATVRFTLEGSTPLSLLVQDMCGRTVRTLLTETSLPAGRHEHVISMAGLSAGPYLIVLRAEGSVRALPCLKQ